VKKDKKKIIYNPSVIREIKAEIQRLKREKIKNINKISKVIILFTNY